MADNLHRHCGQDGKIFVWNQPAEKIFGWKQHEIIGKSLSETIIPAEYRERHEKGMKHYQATGEGPILNKLIEITAVNREGKHFPVELTLIPLIQGGARFFCAFIRDISERKKAENELQESERFLNRAQAVSKIGSYVFDFTTGIWKSTSESDNIFGFTSTDKHTVDLWVSVLHPDHRSMMTEYFENEVIGKKQRFDKEYKIINKISGKECWVHGIGDLESDSSGNLVSMLAADRPSQVIARHAE